jgi:hypothetical protein
VIAQATTLGTPSDYVAVGGGLGIVIGVDNLGVGERDLRLLGIGQNSSFGAASTAYEAWVISADPAGNLTALVNGVNVPVAPNSGNNGPLGPFFFVGSNGAGSVFMAGSIFEVIAWDTMQDNAQVYAYQHEVTGL